MRSQSLAVRDALGIARLGGVPRRVALEGRVDDFATQTFAEFPERAVEFCERPLVSLQSLVEDSSEGRVALEEVLDLCQSFFDSFVVQCQVQ